MVGTIICQKQMHSRDITHKARFVFELISFEIDNKESKRDPSIFKHGRDY